VVPTATRDSDIGRITGSAVHFYTCAAATDNDSTYMKLLPVPAALLSKGHT